ncbi:MAG: L-ribulose-5-phosphate 4-epimerase AraD [Verrucomicrobiales bacterium]|jgi:L-ribulose-5-phosphate 4-epimerase|nr:L-ribulose-5-phosphate 4-epimerase AraD [Verrucomicrobiales bacterium]
MNFRDIREECCEANRTLPGLGLVDITFGNVSCLDRTKGIFAIKPSGVDYSLLTPENITIMDLDGKKVEGKYNPSSDTETHRRLFQSFGNIRSVVHTHSRNAVVFAQAGRGIPCFGTTHADYFYGEIPATRALTVEEVKSAYELETANVIVELFRDLNPDEIPAVLVSGHGPFTWGSSAKKAVETALALEIVAEMALKTLLLAPDNKPIARHLLDKHYQRKHGANAYYGQSNTNG